MFEQKSKLIYFFFYCKWFRLSFGAVWQDLDVSMYNYIYGIFKNRAILNLTLNLLQFYIQSLFSNLLIFRYFMLYRFLLLLINLKGLILFLDTRATCSLPSRFVARGIGHFFVGGLWIYGTLTNFNYVKLAYVKLGIAYSNIPLMPVFPSLICLASGQIFPKVFYEIKKTLVPVCSLMDGSIDLQLVQFPFISSLSVGTSGLFVFFFQKIYYKALLLATADWTQKKLIFFAYIFYKASSGVISFVSKRVFFFSNFFIFLYYNFSWFFLFFFKYIQVRKLRLNFKKFWFWRQKIKFFSKKFIYKKKLRALTERWTFFEYSRWFGKKVIWNKLCKKKKYWMTAKLKNKIHRWVTAKWRYTQTVETGWLRLLSKKVKKIVWRKRFRWSWDWRPFFYRKKVTYRKSFQKFKLFKFNKRRLKWLFILRSFFKNSVSLTNFNLRSVSLRIFCNFFFLIFIVKWALRLFFFSAYIPFYFVLLFKKVDCFLVGRPFFFFFFSVSFFSYCTFFILFVIRRFLPGLVTLILGSLKSLFAFPRIVNSFFKQWTFFIERCYHIIYLKKLLILEKRYFGPWLFYTNKKRREKHHQTCFRFSRFVNGGKTTRFPFLLKKRVFRIQILWHYLTLFIFPYFPKKMLKAVLPKKFLKFSQTLSLDSSLAGFERLLLILLMRCRFFDNARFAIRFIRHWQIKVGKVLINDPLFLVTNWTLVSCSILFLKWTQFKLKKTLPIRFSTKLKKKSLNKNLGKASLLAKNKNYTLFLKVSPRCFTPFFSFELIPSACIFFTGSRSSFSKKLKTGKFSDFKPFFAPWKADYILKFTYFF